ncbi:hypothetical protein QBC37DRAFT_469533 [Rhypophila decipiens]|uniref:Amidohydrolase n=1 Tax=Rhypophila decipiens TaxID=261697 RepID=A0AAN7BAQ4_9PEZI|nr:hypothetical protein QBC37DRAFT_469533 [Rhypophila decipiens]
MRPVSQFQRVFSFLALSGRVALAADLTNISSALQSFSAEIFPDLKTIGADALTTFQKKDEWKVTPHAYGLPTAWKLETEFRPPATPPKAKLPVIGFLAEYDGLIGIGHACGHNHILLNGLAAAVLARRALAHFGTPAKVVVVGTPDEENTGSKYLLTQSGAFDGVDVWLMAHPTSANAIQPMNARINALTRFAGANHTDVVRKAYEALVLVRDQVAQGVPGTLSSVVAVEDVGMFASNIVQSQISLGISGTTVDAVRELVSSILDDTYPGVTFVASEDTTSSAPSTNVNLTVFGSGGHSSENTKSPLVLTIETFRALTSSTPNSPKVPVTFYLPGNTTSSVLDITFNIRTRHTPDLAAVLSFVENLVSPISSSITTDTPYPALEVTPFLPQIFQSIMSQPLYGSQAFPISTFAPASTGASWIQGAEVDPITNALVRAGKVVFHPNFSICNPDGGMCAFNHEPRFREVAGTEYSYAQTERVARGLAELAPAAVTMPVPPSTPTPTLT